MPEHNIELTSGFLDGGWTATCSCGWTGTRQDTMREAAADSASHREFAACTHEVTNGYGVCAGCGLDLHADA